MKSVYSFIGLLGHREADKPKTPADSFFVSHKFCRSDCATLTEVFSQLVISHIIIDILDIDVWTLHWQVKKNNSTKNKRTDNDSYSEGENRSTRVLGISIFAPSVSPQIDDAKSAPALLSFVLLLHREPWSLLNTCQGKLRTCNLSRKLIIMRNHEVKYQVVIHS